MLQIRLSDLNHPHVQVWQPTPDPETPKQEPPPSARRAERLPSPTARDLRATPAPTIPAPPETLDDDDNDDDDDVSDDLPPTALLNATERAAFAEEAKRQLRKKWIEREDGQHESRWEHVEEDLDDFEDLSRLMVGSGLAGIVGLQGRENELSDLALQIKRRQSVLLMGERGVGKSALLEQLAHEQSESTIYLRQSKPLTVLFEDLFEQLYEQNLLHTERFDQADYDDFPHLWRGLKRLTSTAKINLLEQILAVHPKLVFVMDDIDHIPVTAERLLRLLVENATLVATATRQSKPLMSIYFRIKKFTLAPLPDLVIKRICEKFFRLRELNVQDERHIIKHLQRAVAGRVGALADLLYSVQNEPQVKREHARAFVHTQGTREVNIGLFWVLSLVFIAAFRVYAMKTGNLAVVVIASMVLILIMLFRGFLLKGINARRE